MSERMLLWLQNLNKINISNKVVILEKGVFGGCENLNEITIPYGMINIGDGAFEECKSLKRSKYSG